MRINKTDVKKYALGMGMLAVLLMIPKVGEWVGGAFGTVREKIEGVITK